MTGPNRALARAGKNKQAGKDWAYRFKARLQGHLYLTPIKQNMNELRRIQAEDAGPLACWYDQLAILRKDIPARGLYNFDECCFQLGQG